MKEFKEIVGFIREAVRHEFRQAVRRINQLSSSKIPPGAIAVFGLCMYVPIAILVARGRFVPAAVLLIVLSLLDAFDGELSRIQKKEDDERRILFLATMNRLKEVAVYSGVAFFLASSSSPAKAMWAIVAYGTLLTASYVIAKGEAVVASGRKIVARTTMNRVFSEGIMAFEVRMFVLTVGLAFGQLLWVLIIIALLSAYSILRHFSMAMYLLGK